jgi:hypothetical protein
MEKDAKTVDVRYVNLPGQDEDGEPEAPVEDDEVRTFPIKDIDLREEEVVEEEVAAGEEAADAETDDDDDDASSIRTEDISSDEGATEDDEEEVELDAGAIPVQGVPALVAAALAVGDIEI